MKRENFKAIIKNRSFWKIDKRRGNYELLNGEKLYSYVERLVDSQMKLDNLAIGKDGNLYFAEISLEVVHIMPDFHEDEYITWDEHEKRIENLIWEMII